MFGPSALLQRSPLLVLLAALAAAHLLALALFCRGFLLNRVELLTRSACCESFGFGPRCGSSGESGTAAGSGANRSAAAASGHAPGCWGLRHYDKSVWIVIDALRFDFVAGCPPSGVMGTVRCPSRMPRLLELTQTSVRVCPAAEPALLKRRKCGMRLRLQRTRSILYIGAPQCAQSRIECTTYK